MPAALTRYVAFLRGVMPTNCKMPELKKSFEAAGFKDVKTVLGSGNVVFSAPAQAREKLEARAVAAMQATLGRSFPAIVRSVDELRAILEADPFARLKLPEGAKRVVTFLRDPPAKKVTLPPEIDGARILSVKGSEAYTMYVRGASSPVFMTLIEKTFGKDVTTRTWETVMKVVR